MKTLKFDLLKHEADSLCELLRSLNAHGIPYSLENKREYVIVTIGEGY
jgi:hypothetical protein